MTTFDAIRSEHSSRFLVPSLLALLCLGLLLPLYGIKEQSLWLDELWTAAASDPALSWEAWMSEWILPDVHPPLHLLLLRGWRSIFGGEPLALRLLSFVFGVGLVVSVLLIQRWMPVVRQPLALAAWFACSAGVVLYSQEARPYALLLLATTVATLLAVGIAKRMQRQEPVAAPLAVMAVAVVVAEYSHFFGALAGAGLFGALALFAVIWHRRYLLSVILSGALSVGLLLPWLALHVPRMAEKLGGNFWVTNRWYEDFRGVAGLIAGSPYLFLAIAALVALVLVRRPRLLREPGCWIPLWAMLLMVLSALAISLHTPIVTDRNLLILLPPFLLLAATAVSEYLEAEETGLGRSGIVLLMLVAGAALLSGYRVTTLQKDQWREAAAQVEAVEGCEGATLPVYYWPEEVYAYYLSGSWQGRLKRVSLIEHDPPDLERVTRSDGDCPLILWSGHLIGPWVVDWVLNELKLDHSDIVVWRTQGNMIILDRELLEAED